jgi:elongation factor Ts
MTISASLVMELRARTGAGMMECKKFLVAAGGDIEQAVVEMRKSGQAKADKKSSRVASEGVIVVHAQDGHGVIIEINSETDFVARDANFNVFANAVIDTAVAGKIATVEDLLASVIVGESATIEESRQALVAKIGENIQLRRLATLSSSGSVAAYLHGGRIAVLVAIDKNDEALGRDLAMHIAASKPTYIHSSEVPAEVIAKETEIYAAQALETGKPKEIIDKMVTNRIAKFVDEVSLYGQVFVKDSSVKIEQLLKQKQAKVTGFVRFEVGEGIEKKREDFAAEVMAQVRGQDN